MPSVKLVALTCPIVLAAPMSAEDLMVYCARVSNPDNQTNFDTSEKLLKYCLDRGHWSVFEQADMTLEIITSRGIGEQILRHRSFTFQIFSQRYADPTECLDFEIYEARRQDNKNRQNSIDDLSQDVKDWFQHAQQAVILNCEEFYEYAIDMGIAKEQARFLLPLSVQTKLYMKGNVRSWIHYLQARDADGVQKEHRDIAVLVKGIFKEQFPLTAKALGRVDV